MFLLFTLQRLDVWPTGDYGVRTGYGIAYGLAERTDRQGSSTSSASASGPTAAWPPGTAGGPLDSPGGRA